MTRITNKILETVKKIDPQNINNAKTAVSNLINKPKDSPEIRIPPKTPENMKPEMAPRGSFGDAQVGDFFAGKLKRGNAYTINGILVNVEDKHTALGKIEKDGTVSFWANLTTNRVTFFHPLTKKLPVTNIPFSHTDAHGNQTYTDGKETIRIKKTDPHREEKLTNCRELGLKEQTTQFIHPWQHKVKALDAETHQKITVKERENLNNLTRTHTPLLNKLFPEKVLAKKETAYYRKNSRTPKQNSDEFSEKND